MICSSVNFILKKKKKQLHIESGLRGWIARIHVDLSWLDLSSVWSFWCQPFSKLVARIPPKTFHCHYCILPALLRLFLFLFFLFFHLFMPTSHSHHHRHHHRHHHCYHQHFIFILLNFYYNFFSLSLSFSLYSIYFSLQFLAFFLFACND